MRRRTLDTKESLTEVGSNLISLGLHAAEGAGTGGDVVLLVAAGQAGLASGPMDCSGCCNTSIRAGRVLKCNVAPVEDNVSEGPSAAAVVAGEAAAAVAPGVTVPCSGEDAGALVDTMSKSTWEGIARSNVYPGTQSVGGPAGAAEGGALAESGRAERAAAVTVGGTGVVTATGRDKIDVAGAGATRLEVNAAGEGSKATTGSGTGASTARRGGSTGATTVAVRGCDGRGSSYGGGKGAQA